MRKLLSLKKLALKNQATAINLENLLPQALSDPSPFTVPSNGSEVVSDFGDLFSPSMYGDNNFSCLLGGMADVMNLDPLMLATDRKRLLLQYSSLQHAGTV